MDQGISQFCKTNIYSTNYPIAIQKSMLLLKHCAKLFLLSLAVCTNKYEAGFAGRGGITLCCSAINLSAD